RRKRRNRNLTRDFRDSRAARRRVVRLSVHFLRLKFFFRWLPCIYRFSGLHRFESARAPVRRARVRVGARLCFFVTPGRRRTLFFLFFGFLASGSIAPIPLQRKRRIHRCQVRQIFFFLF